jgi:hypothetical protein
MTSRAFTRRLLSNCSTAALYARCQKPSWVMWDTAILKLAAEYRRILQERELMASRANDA